MNKVVYPGQISGTIIAPPSKSYGQRALIASLLHNGVTHIKNLGNDNDTLAVKNIIEQLGAEVSTVAHGLIVKSCGIQNSDGVINFNESGLAARMLTPILATTENAYTCEAKGSLQKRSMEIPLRHLEALGVKVDDSSQNFPYTIQGILNPMDTQINGSLGSQYISGLIMAYSVLNAENVKLKVNEMVSIPYLKMTLEVMKDFGRNVPLFNEAESVFYFSEKTHTPPEIIHYKVENDWSNAAFWMVAGAIAGKVKIKGLDLFSEQGDKQILTVLQMTEAHLSIKEDAIKVGTNKLKPFHYDATHTPDLFPPLLALATKCEGTSVIEGVKRLSGKESNRAETLVMEFSKMGVRVYLQDDMMIIEGGAKLNGAKVNSHNDHRIAMSLAIAALSANESTEIVGAECVDKSYPNFFKDLELLSDQF